MRRHPGRGAGVPAALAVAFVVLVIGVVTKGALVRLDVLVNSHVPGRDDGPQVLHDFAMAVITAANPPFTIVAFLLVVLGWALRARSWWPVVAAAPPVLAMSGTVLLGKWLLGRPGPPSGGPLGSLGAFPSGHTATALVCAGTLAALVGFVRPGWRTVARLSAATWALLVGWGVVWMHYHWLSDVVGSFLLGSLVLWVFYRWPWSLHRDSPLT